MIDYKPTLKANLEKIGVPVYYELFVDSSTETPCITYIENDNTATLEGDDLFYSRLAFYIKVWGKDLALLMPITAAIDTVMREQGFKRTSFNELSVGTQLELIMNYEATGYEKI